jgi:A/G-specific adenine glycosylase
VTRQQVIECFRSSLLRWGSDNLRSFPWRETTEPYEVLIAEILLQKTAAEKVECIFEEFISTYPSPVELAEANRGELADTIYSLGFQNQRSKALVSVGQTLQDGEVPDDIERLLELPYVGRYAANATLCFAFGEPRPIVDANVIRIYNRIFDTDFDYRDEAAWQFAEEVLPETDTREFNLAILDFAAEICVPKTPNCEECFFTDQCSYYRSVH